jgi:16S rRNA (cytidine1402-2'-O)-methyltransferase
MSENPEPMSPPADHGARKGRIHLIPSVISDEGYDAIPPSVSSAVRVCSAFFVENERTARRYLKRIWPEMVVDELQWHLMDPADTTLRGTLKALLEGGRHVGIVSDAGCPGVADPGQSLVAMAHEMGASVHPLAGPSSILLALMASGMNGQKFRFNGYLPTDKSQRMKALKELEAESQRTGGTEIFMETPYRNDAMREAVMQSCRGTTRLCIAVDIGSADGWIRTLTVSQWKREDVSLHKRPAIFLISAS